MSLNKVMLIGRLGKDPELRHTQSGHPVANFSLATSERWSDKSGQKQEKTEWHKVTVWGSIANNCAKYLKRGSQAFVEGRLQTRQWDDPNGQKKYSTEILAHSVQFLDSAPRTGPVEQTQDPVNPGFGTYSDNDIPF